MKRRMSLAVALLAAVSLFAAFATTASAFPNASFPTRCSTTGCHSGAGAAPVATLVTNNGTTATYNVTSTGQEWAVFNGATRVAGAPGSTGQFSVAVGGTYTLFTIYGAPSSPNNLGQATVTPGVPVTTFVITPTAGANGSISPASAQTVNSGANATFNITANAGYHVADVLVDGASIGAVASHTFTNVTANHTISASFAIDVLTTFVITPTAGANGSISPASAQTVVSGASSTFNIAADSGFHVADVLVDGVSIGAVGSHTFTNVTADHTISASFAANPVGTFTITPSAGAGGSITPSTVQTVASGGSATFDITADSGFHVETVLVDGVIQIPVPTSYTFSNVTADHTISATFSNDVDVAVPTALTLHSSNSSVRRYKLITLSSVLSADAAESLAGLPVRYEVKRPGSKVWAFLQTRITDADGDTHTTRRKLGMHGTYQFRVRFLGTDDLLQSHSPTVKVVVN